MWINESKDYKQAVLNRLRRLNVANNHLRKAISNTVIDAYFRNDVRDINVRHAIKVNELIGFRWHLHLVNQNQSPIEVHSLKQIKDIVRQQIFNLGLDYQYVSVQAKLNKSYVNAFLNVNLDKTLQLGRLIRILDVINIKIELL